MIEPGIMLVLIPVLHYYIGAIITVMLSEVIQMHAGIWHFATFLV